MLWAWYTRVFGPATAWPAIWFMGLCQWVFCRKHLKAGRAALLEAKQNTHDALSLVNWYRKNGFAYKADTYNWYQRPWVTAATKRGDCEDFAFLSYEILKKRTECKIVLCHGRREGKRRGHAFVIAKEGDKWRELSNTRFGNLYDNKVEAAKSFYGKDTTDFCFLI
jgi:hypothetical protein